MTEREWRGIFATRLSEQMKKSNLTRRELVSRANICESSLSHYFSGRHTPTVKTVLRLSRALGCTVEDLAHSGELIR